MPDILHRVGIQASAETVFKAIATIDGISSWWITGTTGESAIGKTIHFEGFVDMKVAALEPHRLVQWKCVSGDAEWIGTDVSFRLVPKENQVYVLFSHANWREPSEFMHHCSTKWATFLLSLKSWSERGEGRPLPYDLKIEVGE